MKIGDKLICNHDLVPSFKYIKGKTYIIYDISNIDVPRFWLVDDRNVKHGFSLKLLNEYFYCVREQRKDKIHKINESW